MDYPEDNTEKEMEIPKDREVERLSYQTSHRKENRENRGEAIFEIILAENFQNTETHEFSFWIYKVS